MGATAQPTRSMKNMLATASRENDRSEMGNRPHGDPDHDQVQGERDAAKPTEEPMVAACTSGAVAAYRRRRPARRD